jgi:phosphoribosylaminoimidazole carboxylase
MPLIREFARVSQARIQAARETPKVAAKDQSGASGKPLVLVTMGSDWDLPALKAGLDILKKFDVPFKVNVTSAHSTPSYMADVAAAAAG